jgi:hypothetical protein
VQSYHSANIASIISAHSSFMHTCCKQSQMVFVGVNLIEFNF